MAKFFNTGGLCFPDKHYMVDPLKRLTDVEVLIKKELYFTLDEKIYWKEEGYKGKTIIIVGL